LGYAVASSFNFLRIPVAIANKICFTTRPHLKQVKFDGDHPGTHSRCVVANKESAHAAQSLMERSIPSTVESQLSEFQLSGWASYLDT